MEAAAIIQILAWALPLAEKAGVEIYSVVEGLKAGKTVDDLVAETIAKRNDLEELPFSG